MSRSTCICFGAVHLIGREGFGLGANRCGCLSSRRIDERTPNGGRYPSAVLGQHGECAGGVFVAGRNVTVWAISV